MWSTSEAEAQSMYGCTNLDDGSFSSAFEGVGGVFYSITPDLDSHHNISEKSVAQVARLAAALQAQGTTLVYVPVPTKALGWPDKLGPVALDYGFDIDLATTVYDDAVRRLREAGVVTVDARNALVTSSVERPAYLRTDPRLTTEGVRRVAEATAAAILELPEFQNVARSTFTSASGTPMMVQSALHARLQQACLSDLPKPQILPYSTAMAQRAGNALGANIFAGQSGSQRRMQIAAVGTEMTGMPEMNFAGFLSEFSGIETVHYAVNGGGAFGAISSYLTSTPFQTGRPSVLVWEVPIQHNLGQYGDQPMAELIAAAQGPSACRTPLTAFTMSNSEIRVDLTPLDPGARYTLFLDAGEVPATEARFVFTNRQGLTRTRAVVRNKGQVATGRFFVPTSGLWRDGAVHLDIALDANFGPQPRVVACLEQEGM
ncbi:alginate O-acetyltransferase AlgX-related protein [Pseudaestuariivita sp.]|uniref:alginate O-acetyltransferase AlgX-related protein n=1 Tax=Pseudaestuariivita sp. TaxID=2211669 RepID=UPI00405A0A84